jgi:hypothetical protein
MTLSKFTNQPANKEIVDTINDIIDAMGSTTGANIDLSNLSATGQAVIDAKVNKSGDTMTGDLTILNDNGFFTVKSSFDSTTTSAPSEFINLGTLAMYDTNDNITGFIQNSFNTNNTVKLSIGARRIISGVDKTAMLGLTVDSSGNASCKFPNTTCVDGQWVKNVASLSTSSAVGTYNLTNTLKAKLPNDSYNYEILLAVNGRSTGSSQCSLITAYTSEEYVLWLTANSRSAGTFIILPVDAARTLTQKVTGAAFGAIEIKLQAYRRIGTNS